MNNEPSTDQEYEIELYTPSKYVGGTRHTAMYTCGFWRNRTGHLVALHRDVKTWTPTNSNNAAISPN